MPRDMTRYDSRHKSLVREKLLSTASKLVRKHGYHGVAVSDVMAANGLTVGGFYAHFSSKDDLVLNAFSKAIKATSQLAYVQGIEELTGRAWVNEVTKRVLNEYLLSDWENGCPLTALVTDIGRGSRKLRETFATELSDVIALIASRLTHLPKGSRVPSARVMVSLFAGAMNIARALPDPEQAKQHLSSCREFVVLMFDALEKKP